MKSFSPVLVSAIALLSACTSSGGNSTPDSGSGSGGSASGGANGSGGTGSGGSGSGGESGSGGVGTGGAGTGGAMEPGVDGGMDAPKDGGAGETAGMFTKQWTCPPGPFANDNIGARKQVCMGFNFRYNYVEGPTWIASQHAFYFSNFKQGTNNGGVGDIIKVTPSTGTCETFVQDVGCNGLAVHANGKLIGACHRNHAIMEFDPVTKAKRVIADGLGGKTFDSPNDLVAHSSGTIYFSNPNYETNVPGPPASTGTGVFWIDPKEVVHLLYATGGGEPNGVALSPDEKTLYVVGAGTWKIDDTGMPVANSRMGNAPGGDGLAVNCGGQIFAPMTNSSFGGDDGKTMLIVSGSPGNPRVETVQMMVPGIP